jgi:hypothetical protein
MIGDLQHGDSGHQVVHLFGDRAHFFGPLPSKFRVIE